LWLGGPDGPRIAHHSIGPVWWLIKMLVILVVYVWIRATLPRLRYDQLMDLGWKVLIPGALAWLMIVAGFQVDRPLGFVAIGASLILGALFWQAIHNGRDATDLEAAERAKSVVEEASSS